jgi:hypothetical protein
MDDNRPDDPTPSPDRPKRAPPTIDLTASEVTSASDADGNNNADGRSSWRSFAAVPPFLVAAASGALTAVVVIAVAWALGWPAQNPQPTAEAQTSAIAALSSRIAELEGLKSKPAEPDPALASRFNALEKSLAAVRTDIAGARARSDKLATELDAIKAVPSSSATPQTVPDLSSLLSALENRLAEVERAARAESETIAQAANKPADDTALRRLVVASMLEISVRQGEPFAQALKAAKALAPDPQMLQPLDDFASSGLPNAANLCRELLTLVPKLEPPAPQGTTGSGIVDRLQAGASKLVRIERTDATGNDRAAIVARVTAAAVRNDLPDTRRELELLAPADRAVAQGWLDKVKARETALMASRHFAKDAMAALAKPAP